MEQIHAYLKGMATGLIFVFSFGPVFFAVIETSILKGFWPAAAIAFGTLISDAALIFIAFLGVSTIMDNPDVKYWFGVIGGGTIIIYGIMSMFKKSKIAHVEINVKKRDYFGFFFKGFVINFLNPFVFIFWFNAMGVVSVEGFEGYEKLFFFIGVLATIFSSDILKAFIAQKIQKIINPQYMHWVNMVAGAVMLGLGVRLIWKVLHHDSI